MTSGAHVDSRSHPSSLHEVFGQAFRRVPITELTLHPGREFNSWEACFHGSINTSIQIVLQNKTLIFVLAQIVPFIVSYKDA